MIINCPKCKTTKDFLGEKDTVKDQIKHGKLIVDMVCSSCGETWEHEFYEFGAVLEMIQKITKGAQDEYGKALKKISEKIIIPKG